MKVYLDNNVVSAIGRNDTLEEAEAISALLRAFDEGKVELVTSDVTRQEIEKHEFDEREVVKRIYYLLKKVPFIESQGLGGFNVYGDEYTWINSPRIDDDPIWSKLMTIGLKNIDAHHVMLAMRSSCDVFLTCDRGILSRQEQIEKEFGIRIIKPSGAVSLQGW